MKKILLLFAAVCCMMVANAQTTQPKDEIWYTSTDGNVVEPNNDDFGARIVSNTYNDGKGVIKFNNNISQIGEYVFGGLSKLSSIAIPEGVTSIGYAAFNGCTGLVSVTLPSSLTSIGDFAFTGSGLNSITIPGSVTSFGERTFADCQFLTSVTLQDGVTSIGDFGFWGCEELASVTIPGSVTSIGECAFLECEKLTSVTLPEGLTIIKQCAFAGTGITDIVIPTTLISIGEDAFCNLDLYRNVYLLRLFPQDYDPTAFNSKMQTIYVPSVTREAYSSIYGNEIATIPWDTYKSHAITAINTEIMANAVKLTDKDVEDIQKFIDIIKNTESESEAEAALNEVIELIAASGDDYAWYKELFFGSLGIEQEGPAIEITAPDGKVIRLYNPKSVKYINK